MTESSNPVLAHLATLPEPQRETLLALRAILLELLPEGEESISYRMPCIKVGGKAVAGYDGFAKHCSYFPHSGGVVSQLHDLPSWCTPASAGTLQFPVDRPLPREVVAELVHVRLQEIATKAASKRSRSS